MQHRRARLGMIGGSTLAAVLLFSVATAYHVQPPPLRAPPEITAQIGTMAVIALMIERAVEVYLGLLDRNGAERSALPGESARRAPATQAAALAGLVLGLLVAACGLRILPSAGLAQDPHLPTAVNLIRTGVDVLLSGALMGGGSMLAHEAAEAVKSGFRRLGR